MEKMLDVNVLETMKAIAKSAGALVSSSFLYDQEEIMKAARQKPQERNSFLWICYLDGTELYPLSDAFKGDSPAYDNAQFYQNGERAEEVPVYYEVEISRKRSGIVWGNIYAVDSRWFAELARDTTACCATPQAGFEKYLEIRSSLPESSLSGHLEHRRQERIRSEARRIVEKLERMEAPNIPVTNLCAIALSRTFRAGIAEGDIAELNQELRKIVHGPTPFVLRHPDLHILCAGREIQKPSIKEQLMQKPEYKNPSAKKPKRQKER